MYLFATIGDDPFQASYTRANTDRQMVKLGLQNTGREIASRSV